MEIAAKTGGSMAKFKSKRLGLQVVVVLGCGGLLVACEGAPFEPGSVVTKQAAISTDIAGPVDLQGEQPTKLTTEISGEVQDTRPAMRSAKGGRQARANRQQHHLAGASQSKRKPLKHVVAHRLRMRTQAKVSAVSKPAGPKI